MLLESLFAVLRTLGAQPLTPLFDVSAGDGRLATLLRQRFLHIDTTDSILVNQGEMISLSSKDLAVWQRAQSNSAWVVSRPLAQPGSPASTSINAVVRESFIRRGLNTILVVPTESATTSVREPARSLVAALEVSPFLCLHVAPEQPHAFTILCWIHGRMSSRSVVINEPTLMSCATQVGSIEGAVTFFLEREFSTPSLPSLPRPIAKNMKSCLIRPVPTRPHIALKPQPTPAPLSTTVPLKVALYSPPTPPQTILKAAPNSPTHSSHEDPFTSPSRSESSSAPLSMGVKPYDSTPQNSEDGEDGDNTSYESYLLLTQPPLTPLSNVHGLEAAQQGQEIVRLIQLYRHSLPKREVIAKICQMKYRSAQRKIRIAKFISKFPEIGKMTQRQAEQYLSENISRRPRGTVPLFPHKQPVY